MHQGTVLAYVSSKFKTHPENVATEALAYILRSSTTAARAFLALIRPTGLEAESVISFEAQHSEDKLGRPDLVGLDANRKKRLVVENKFWAGLTEHQRLSYVHQFSPEHIGVLLFIAPALRLPVLWQELALLDPAQASRSEPPSSNDRLSFWSLDPQRVVAFASWQLVLDWLQTALKGENDHQALSDVAQLRSLCDLANESAFLPIRTDEVSNLEMPRRIVGIAELCKEVISRARD